MVVALGMALASAAHGQGVQASPDSSRHALVVGVSAYRDPTISALQGIEADMRMAAGIAAEMGVPKENIRVLRDSDATKAKILAELDELARRVGQGGRAFIYFSGHGTRWHDPQRKACVEGLMPYDSDPIDREEIAARTRRIGEVADKTLLLFDSCFSGGVDSVMAGTARSLTSGRLVAKALVAKDAESEACMRASNARSLGGAGVSALGLISEDVVHISSARRDEASYDEPGRGGLATQGILRCMIDPRADLDRSGSVNLGEIQACAQRFIEDKLKPFPELKPHHVTISGSRNLVPVAVNRLRLSFEERVRAAETALLQIDRLALPPDVDLPVLGSLPAVLTPPTQPPPPPPLGGTPDLRPPVAPPAPPTTTPPVSPSSASWATLQDLLAQASRARQLEVLTDRSVLRIDRDPLTWRLRSSHDGHVYVIMLGSDQKSFYLLYPNALDQDNRIKARQWLALPRPHWSIVAKGPPGENQLLLVVTDTPRDLSALSAAPATAAEPFVFMLNDDSGRGHLLSAFLGAGVKQGSERYAARLIRIREVP